MSEQTIQEGLYSEPVQMHKYTCRSLGATTILDLVKSREISGLTIDECRKIRANKPDVLVLNRNREIVVFIEMKKPSELSTQKQIEKAKMQELNVAKQTKAKIYIISDGDHFIWLNPLTGGLITDEDGNPIERKINPKDLSEEEKKDLAEYIDRICYCIDDSNDRLLPQEYIDPTPLAKKTARIMQNMSLSSAKNSLYTFVEMFTFKFLSDIGILKGIYGFDSILRISMEQGNRDAFCQYLTTVRQKLLQLFPIADDNTSIINGRLFHTQIDEMGNPIIIDTAAECFGSLLRCFSDYEKEHGKFLYINHDFKSKLFETFMKNSTDKDGMGQFFTPLRVVNEMVRMTDVREGMKICDPACGVGKFLLEAASRTDDPFYFENGELRSRISLYGFEKRMEDNNDDLTTILAKSNFLIHYSDLFKSCNDSEKKIRMLAEQLLNTVIKSSHSALGTLSRLDPEKFDLILTNPPYYMSSAISKASESIRISGTETPAYTAGGLGIEALFLEWIVKSLKKGGEANVVLPDGIFTNIRNSGLKKLILSECYIESIISLPVGTFFNTPKKTFILTLHRRTDAEKKKNQPYPVFAYLCSSIGETLDSYRFETNENDLDDAVSLYCAYRGAKDSRLVAGAISENQRAKLADISMFSPDASWDIGLLWSPEEKEKLGIKKSENVMSISEFRDAFSEFVDEANSCMKSMPKETPVKYCYVRPSELFEPKNGSPVYTKEYCEKHHGSIPLYSGNTEGAFAKIDSCDYDGQYLTWVKDGLAGYIMFHDGKFSITSHRGILIPTEKCRNIDLKYIKFVLEPVFRASKKGREGDLGRNEYTTLNPSMIRKIAATIPVPVKDDGTFDLEKQKELASKYEQIEEMKKELSRKLNELTDITIS